MVGCVQWQCCSRPVTPRPYLWVNEAGPLLISCKQNQNQKKTINSTTMESFDVKVYKTWRLHDMPRYGHHALLVGEGTQTNSQKSWTFWPTFSRIPYLPKTFVSNNKIVHWWTLHWRKSKGLQILAWLSGEQLLYICVGSIASCAPPCAGSGPVSSFPALLLSLGLLHSSGRLLILQRSRWPARGSWGAAGNDHTTGQGFPLQLGLSNKFHHRSSPPGNLTASKTCIHGIVISGWANVRCIKRQTEASPLNSQDEEQLYNPAIYSPSINWSPKKTENQLQSRRKGWSQSGIVAVARCCQWSRLWRSLLQGGYCWPIAPV